MSFQGDVGGIGLADLLQSLARGREGVLTLTTKAGLKSTLGVQSGLLHLLPEIDEDPEYWRNRARQAWVKDPDFRIDSLRMVEIARAQRIENLYSLLDSQGVHFRFVPGPLPARPVESAMSQGEPGTARKGHRRDAVYSQGMSVEGLLLEFARLSDEIESAGPTIVSSDHAVVCLFEPGYATEGSERLLAECDGYSNLIEIADRLGWPMRQMRLNANVQLARGVLRFAEPHELLALGAQELAQSNFARAASRLSAWCETAMPGPLPPPDAEFLEMEWQAGRLASAVHAMPARHGRTLLRRIDLALVNPVSAAEHWLELAKAHKDDELSALHAMMCQVRTGIDPNVPSISELMAVARRFSERSQFLRARAVLRIAAARLPDATSVRLDVAMHMLAAGIKRESVGILVECARSLIDEGKFENAVPPLRAVIEAEPAHREARRLLSRARTKVMQRTIVRKNSLVTIAVVLAISVGAVVQYRSHREYDSKISQITLVANEPRRALKILEQLFPGEKSGSVAELRDSLLERMKFEENAVRTAWTDRYREAQLECTLGDPVLGLQRALDLPDPPAHDENGEPWPLVSDLYNGLAARLDALLTEMGNAVDEKSEQLHDEQRLHNLIADLQSALQQWEAGAKERKQTAPTEARDFEKRLVELEKNLTARSEQRAQARADGVRQANLARQDLLLAAARAHAEAGDHARAMSAYERLIETDETHKLKDLLAKEMQAVEKKSGALAEARALALKGDHARAREILGQSVENFRDYLLPWRLKSFPSGARATLADGSVRVTPVVFETAFDEHVDIVLELDGYEPTKLSIDQPADRMVVLSRLPERWWQTHSRVEALPVATGEDHVLADRSGWIVRMSKDSHVVWQAKLSSLAGVARSPVFLPKKPGHLLLVSEDGAAWIVNAANGSMDGPLELGSPPREGPVATDSGARVRLRDGRVAEWEARLKPEMLDDFGPDTPLSAGAKDDSLSTGSTAGLAVMRRGTNAGTKLASPWTGDSIEISDEYYSVRNGGSADPSFTVRRTGDWTFVAFEAPHSLIPRGRLWIADGRGLLSYVP